MLRLGLLYARPRLPAAAVALKSPAIPHESPEHHWIWA